MRAWRSIGSWLLLLALLALAPLLARSAPATATAAPTGMPMQDGSWVEGFGGFGVTGHVYATAADAEGNVYIGGTFNNVFGVTANNVAHWDGRQWHPLGKGVAGYVYTMALAPDGDLYVGGLFGWAGEVPYTGGIARWDGKAWHAVGYGIATSGEEVQALAFGPDGKLIVGGSFTTLGAPGYQNLAQWDGTNWASLGSVVGGPVNALAFAPDGTLYAGGQFYQVGDQIARNLAKWDGSAWSQVTPYYSNLPTVLSLAVNDQGTVCAGAGSGVWCWSGQILQFLGSIGYPESLAWGPDGSLYAGGRLFRSPNNLLRWNGSSWTPVGSEALGAVYALLWKDEHLYVGGQNYLPGPPPRTGFAIWDGSQWSTLGESGHGLNGTVVDLVSSGSTDLYAAGQFTLAGNVPAHGIARWDGTAWHALGSLTVTDANALAVTPGSIVYVGTTGGKLHKWDGAGWSTIGNANGSIHALAVDSSGQLYAGGAFSSINGTAALYRIARWDGSQWHPLGAGLSGPVHELVVGADDVLYVGGDFLQPQAFSGLARWDGQSWRGVGYGMNGVVRAVALGPDGSLYVGGTFTQAGSTPVNNVARWDGSQWGALGSGITDGANEVRDLLLHPNGELFATGQFNTAGGQPSQNVARWTGMAWEPLGSGLQADYSVPDLTPQGFSLARVGEGVYVGGLFDVANRIAANDLALWQPKPPATPTPTATNTPVPTASPIATATPTETAVPSATGTPVGTATPTGTATPPSTRLYLPLIAR